MSSEITRCLLCVICGIKFRNPEHARNGVIEPLIYGPTCDLQWKKKIMGLLFIDLIWLIISTYYDLLFIYWWII